MGPHSGPVYVHDGAPDASRVLPETTPTDAALELVAQWRASLTQGRAVWGSVENVGRLDALSRTIEDLRDEVTGLRTALTSREDIDEAKGILMATQGCSRDAAFEALVTMSQKSNVPLKEVARALVYQAARA
jgi:hypothetical protein